MTYSEDYIALAAEYVLGTLDADERVQVETMMSVDRGFRAVVEAWEVKFGGLNQMVSSVEPPTHVWDRIRLAAGLSEAQLPFVLPQVADAPIVAPVIAAEPIASAVPRGEVIALSDRLRRSRSVAQLMTALAAALVAFIGVQAYRPDLLPQSLRPKGETKIVEVAAAPAAPAIAPAQFVAVLQKGPDSPAFLLSVDLVTKNFTVRTVGAEPEAGKSYELWLVSDKLDRPRSLGLIGNDAFVTRPALANYDTDTINKATYAVTVEPQGGAPNGVATGPIVYTGKLIEAVPSGK